MYFNNDEDEYEYSQNKKQKLDIDFYFDMVTIALKSEDILYAKYNLDIIIEASPLNIKAYLLYAKIYIKMDDIDNLLKCCKTILIKTIFFCDHISTRIKLWICEKLDDIVRTNVANHAPQNEDSHYCLSEKAKLVIFMKIIKS